MTDRISLAGLGDRRSLDSGAQGEVFAAPGLRMRHASSLVFKRYRPEVAAALDVAVLESMPAYLESLPFSEGMELLSLAAWPCRLVEDGGVVAGFVMPAIPDAFFVRLRKSSGVSREAAEFQHLLNDEGFLSRRGISLSGRDRYGLLLEVARALSVFHRHGIAVGDLSPKNLLFTLDPEPGVYFIDCDSMRIGGRSAVGQAETPDWRVRDVNPAEELATAASDGYKLGLLVLRLLAGSQDARDPGRLPPAVPEGIRRLTASALSADPARRPAPAEWITPLQAAASAASTQRTQATRPPKAAGSSRAAGPPRAEGGTPARPAPPPPPAPAPAPAQPVARVPLSFPAPARRWRGRLRAAVIVTISVLAVTGVILWALANPDASQPPPLRLTTTRTATFLDPNGDSVDAVAFGPGGTLAAGGLGHTYIGDDIGSTTVWDIATGKLIATFTDPSSQGVTGVAFGPGDTLAVGDGNGSTYLWDTATGKLTATLADPGGGGVTGVAFAPGGTTLAAGDDTGSTYLWDTATGKLTATLTDPGFGSGPGVEAVAFGPKGTTLATGDIDGSTYLWDTATGKLTATFTNPGYTGGASVAAVALSPGGAILAAGDDTGSTYLWDTATGKLIATLTDPSNPGGDAVDGVAFGLGGAILAVADNSTYLWDIATGKIVATFTGSLTDPYSYCASAVAFGPGGTTLAGGGEVGSTCLWHISKRAKKAASGVSRR